MFEVGFTELLVIFVLALIVLGPEKLPRLAAQVGRWIGRARAMAKQFREQLEEEVNVAEANKWKPTPAPQPTAQSEPTGTPEATATPDATAASEASAAPDAAVTPQAAVTPAPQANGQAESHASGPPPEPEATAYQPPAYASPSSTAPSAAVESQVSETASHDTAAPSHEPPARPGDVITQTHERGI
jgi:sec-independent protein translocase protein TatB